MVLDKTYGNIAAFHSEAVAFFKHLIGLSNPRSRAQKDPELASVHDVKLLPNVP
jgi:hypothetical protein